MDFCSGYCPESDVTAPVILTDPHKWVWSQLLCKGWGDRQSLPFVDRWKDSSSENEVSTLSWPHIVS